MRVGVLGSLSCHSGDGRAVAVSGQRQRLLLALLASRRGRSVPPEALVDALWGDDLPANPSAALHSQVARLRRALSTGGGHGDAIASDPVGYRLALDPDRVDAHRFEELLAHATEPGIPPPGVVARLEAALGLWRGRAFEEFADVDELRIEGVRLDELRLVAEERLGAALVEDGRAAEAIARLEPLAEQEPFREAVVAALMRAYAATGRTAEALRRYQAYRSRLADEAGLEPSASLRRLDAELATGGDEVVDDTVPTLEQMSVTYVPSPASPGVRLAVGRVGSGPPLVSVPAWVSSLDVIASSRDPRSALLERLAAHAEVIAYDNAGTGLSRGPVTDFSSQAGAADLAAVIEHVGRAPVALLAASAAGPVAIRLAAERPDLVARLVLFGTFGDPSVAFPKPEFSEALVRLVRASWSTGSTLLAQLYRPGVSDDAVGRLATVLRDSADADVGAAYLEATHRADVSSLVPEVRQPALVIHYRGDRVVPFAGGEHLAGALPDARFVPIDGAFHLPDLADVERIDRSIAAFLSSERV